MDDSKPIIEAKATGQFFDALQGIVDGQHLEAAAAEDAQDKFDQADAEAAEPPVALKPSTAKRRTSEDPDVARVVDHYLATIATGAHVTSRKQSITNVSTLLTRLKLESAHLADDRPALAAYLVACVDRYKRSAAYLNAAPDYHYIATNFFGRADHWRAFAADDSPAMQVKPQGPKASARPAPPAPPSYAPSCKLCGRPKTTMTDGPWCCYSCKVEAELRDAATACRESLAPQTCDVARGSKPTADECEFCQIAEEAARSAAVEAFRSGNAPAPVTVSVSCPTCGGQAREGNASGEILCPDCGSSRNSALDAKAKECEAKGECPVVLHGSELGDLCWHCPTGIKTRVARTAGKVSAA